MWLLSWEEERFSVPRGCYKSPQLDLHRLNLIHVGPLQTNPVAGGSSDLIGWSWLESANLNNLDQLWEWAFPGEKGGPCYQKADFQKMGETSMYSTEINLIF